MTTRDKVLEQALEALLAIMDYPDIRVYLGRQVSEDIADPAIAAIKEELAKPAPEPVAWVTPLLYGSRVTFYKPPKPSSWVDTDDYPEWFCKPIYLSPPPPKVPEGWLAICLAEVERGKLVSNPKKFRFAESHGMQSLDEVHDWMHKAYDDFEKMVLSAAPQPPSD